MNISVKKCISLTFSESDQDIYVIRENCTVPFITMLFLYDCDYRHHHYNMAALFITYFSIKKNNIFYDDVYSKKCKRWLMVDRLLLIIVVDEIGEINKLK